MPRSCARSESARSICSARPYAETHGRIATSICSSSSTRSPGWLDMSASSIDSRTFLEGASTSSWPLVSNLGFASACSARRGVSRDWRVRVEDIIEATEHALQFVGEMDAASFKADERTSAAVLHQIFVIGEAAARLPDEIRNRAANVPWEEIIGMRNIIAHGYFDVDLEVAWKTVRVDLPPLGAEMRKLLESAP